jgi:hypothetical protein
LVREDIHREVKRTSGRALLALKAVLNFFSANLKNFRLQGHIFISSLPALVHAFTPVLGREGLPGIFREGFWWGNAQSSLPILLNSLLLFLLGIP